MRKLISKVKKHSGSSPKRTGSREANIKKELDAFDVMNGFEVNLFADERHGIANPLSVRWDAQGRMFVACSDVTLKSNLELCQMIRS